MAKVLFYSNSLQRELEVEAINLKANTFVVRVDKRLMTLDGADKLLDRIRAEARAEFWKELLEEAERHCDRRIELLGPIETSDDAAIRRAMLDGWSAWLLAKKIIDSKRAAILADEPKFEEHELYVYDDAKPLPKE